VVSVDHEVAEGAMIMGGAVAVGGVIVDYDVTVAGAIMRCEMTVGSMRSCTAPSPRTA
jgi:hypothetical protein